MSILKWFIFKASLRKEVINFLSLSLDLAVQWDSAISVTAECQQLQLKQRIMCLNQTRTGRVNELCYESIQMLIFPSNSAITSKLYYYVVEKVRKQKTVRKKKMIQSSPAGGSLVFCTTSSGTRHLCCSSLHTASAFTRSRLL